MIDNFLHIMFCDTDAYIKLGIVTNVKFTFRWENKAWKVLREPQRWLGAARNTGVKQAKGQYIVFLDDDDVAKPDKVIIN
jgi:hypothetical protein